MVDELDAVPLSVGPEPRHAEAVAHRHRPRVAVVDDRVHLARCRRRARRSISARAASVAMPWPHAAGCSAQPTSTASLGPPSLRGSVSRIAEPTGCGSIPATPGVSIAQRPSGPSASVAQRARSRARRLEVGARRRRRAEPAPHLVVRVRRRAAPRRRTPPTRAAAGGRCAAVVGHGPIIAARSRRARSAQTRSRVIGGSRRTPTGSARGDGRSAKAVERIDVVPNSTKRTTSNAVGVPRRSRPAPRRRRSVPPPRRDSRRPRTRSRGTRSCAHRASRATSSERRWHEASSVGLGAVWRAVARPDRVHTQRAGSRRRGSRRRRPSGSPSGRWCGGSSAHSS